MARRRPAFILPGISTVPSSSAQLGASLFTSIQSQRGVPSYLTSHRAVRRTQSQEETDRLEKTTISAQHRTVKEAQDAILAQGFKIVEHNVKTGEEEEPFADIETNEVVPDIPWINRVVMTGRLGNDPELLYIGRGSDRKTPLAKFSLAVQDEVADGEWVHGMERTTSWFPCEVWGRPAESAARILRKGLRVGIEGKLAFSSYTNKKGENVDRAEILVDKFEILQSKTEASSDQPSSASEGASRTWQEQKPRRKPNPRSSEQHDAGSGLSL